MFRPMTPADDRCRGRSLHAHSRPSRIPGIPLGNPCKKNLQGAAFYSLQCLHISPTCQHALSVPRGNHLAEVSCAFLKTLCLGWTGVEQVTPLYNNNYAVHRVVSLNYSSHGVQPEEISKSWLDINILRKVNLATRLTHPLSDIPLVLCPFKRLKVPFYD